MTDNRGNRAGVRPIARAARALGVATLMGCAGMGGCQGYSGQTKTLALAQQGEFGRARAGVAAELNDDSNEAILSRMKLLILSLADGDVDAAAPQAESLYEALRTQGVNSGKTFGAVLVGEQAARTYKGEPFEQAMTYCYMGLVDGLRGDWGNVRATANNSLFSVKDFSRVLTARDRSRDSGDAALNDKLEIARASKQAEAARRDAGDDGLYLNVGDRPSDFELGYVLKAIASRQLTNTGELEEAQNQLAAVAPRLREFADQLARGRYNTVLVVDYGMGPQKIATGPDGVIAGYRARTPSSDEPLTVRVGNDGPLAFPVVTDLNRLSQDVAWNNLEDVRKAKSTIGDVLIVAGAGTAAYGASRDDNRGNGAVLAGLGMALAGAALKATASADTRHCEVMPQRVYVAPIQIPETGAPIEVSVGGERVVIPMLPGPRQADGAGGGGRGGAQLRYLRIPTVQTAWATSGRVLYGNDATGEIAGPENFPYILGGRCVRVPTDEVLASYRRSGYLKNTTLEELIDLYREEGIDVQHMGRPGQVDRHVLEGGTSLATPLAGSAGFLRLMCGEHQPYQPRSARAAELAKTMRVRSENH